jgi:hypothetical protein
MVAPLFPSTNSFPLSFSFFGSQFFVFVQQTWRHFFMQSSREIYKTSLEKLFSFVTANNLSNARKEVNPPARLNLLFFFFFCLFSLLCCIQELKQNNNNRSA